MVAESAPQPSSLVVRLQRLESWLLATGPLLLPPVIALLIYLPAIQYQFVWDDTIYLYDMPVYRMPDSWLQALRLPFVLSPNYYRPLALLTFILEQSLAGLNPAVFHFTNLTLHALNTWLVSLLAYDLLRKENVRLEVGADGSRPSAPSTPPWRTWFAAGLGLIYASHPALMEGVAFISSRFDLLATFFMLLALLAEHRLAGKRRLVCVAVAFLLAALTKEMALALILALPFWLLAQVDFISARERKAASDKSEKYPSEDKVWERLRGWLNGLESQVKSAIGLFSALLCAGLVYLLIRFFALGYLLVAPEHSLPVGGLLSHLLLFTRSLAGYLRLMIWPFGGLTPIHYSVLPVPPSDIAAWMELGVVILAGLGLFQMLRSTRLALRRSGWLILAGIAALLPVSNLLPLELGGGAYIAERFLVFPLVFFVLALAPLLAVGSEFPIRAELTADASQPAASGPSQPGWKILLAGFLISSWLVASFAMVQLTLPNWRDDVSLWRWAQVCAPNSSTPFTNLSLQATDQGRPQEGVLLAQQAIALDPTNANAWNHLGLALLNLQQFSDSQKAFSKATELEPENSLYWNNLAGALRELDNLQDAEKILVDQALRLDPNLPAAHLNLGIVYLKADRPDLAQAELQAAATLLPPGQVGQAQEMLAKIQEPAIWLRLGDLLLNMADYQGAVQAYDTAGRLGASLADVAAGLGTALVKLDQVDQAITLLTDAIQQAPQDARLYNNLGMALQTKGEIESARQLFQKAIELAPDWETPQINLEGLPKE